MITTDDRLSELRKQLSESIARLGELEAAAVAAMIDAKSERDIVALETRKAQALDRVALLQKAIKQLDRQIQTDAQNRMLAYSAEFMAPLVAPLDEAASKLALPPHTGPMHDLTPEVVPAKKVFRWPGNPQEKQGRWNERARGD